MCVYERERVCVCVCVRERERIQYKYHFIQLYCHCVEKFATWFIIYIKHSNFVCLQRTNKYSALLLILEVIVMLMSLDLLCD